MCAAQMSTCLLDMNVSPRQGPSKDTKLDKNESVSGGSQNQDYVFAVWKDTKDTGYS